MSTAVWRRRKAAEQASNIKVGDLCQLDEFAYPQYRGMIGIVKRRRPPRRQCGWLVYINGRTHPYTIEEEFIKVLSERW